jgi:hypothetical protein
MLVIRSIFSKSDLDNRPLNIIFMGK